MRFKPFYLIGLVFAAAMATLAYPNHENAKKSNLTFDNIEALSQAENTGSGKMQCVTSIEYNGGYSMPLYCSTCSYRLGYVPKGSYSECPNK